LRKGVACKNICGKVVQQTGVNDMIHIPRTLCRSDFAPALRFANVWDEDYARESREIREAELALPPIVLTAAEQANEAYWREQERRIYRAAYDELRAPETYTLAGDWS
jgi:hypothetical protein